MPDRHSELPAHPDLEYYRKQAKHLRRAYVTGDATADARVADVLGDRAAERFLLSDAQFVLAQEHGFRTWAEFRAHLESRSTTEDRPVSRLLGIRPDAYASMADALLAELRRNDPGALQRLRAYVPRYVAATVAATAELRDGHPVAFIDFDTVHPGPRIWDVAYAAYRFVPLADSHREDDIPPVQEQARRLRLFADAYRLGDADRSALTDTARARLDHLIRHMHDQADAGNAAFAAHIAAGDETLYRTDAAHIARHQAVFHTALTTPASE